MCREKRRNPIMGGVQLSGAKQLRGMAPHLLRGGAGRLCHAISGDNIATPAQKLRFIRFSWLSPDDFVQDR